MSFVTQPVINNTTGVIGGTLTLTPDPTELTNVTATTTTATPVNPATSPGNNGSFYQIIFANSTHGYAVDSTAAVGNMILVKNVGAVSGFIRIYNSNGSAVALNQVSVANGSYIDFALSSGKKLIVYTNTATKISVSYL
jgi:hypothetical protein